MSHKQTRFLTNRNLSDLNPLVAGEETCAPGHSFGPAVREYTLLHYVIAGKGTFYARGEAFPVAAGQVFCIRPGEVTTYTAHKNDPWRYRWIGFDGKLSADFSRLPPVFSCPERFFPSDESEYLLSASLMELYDYLFAEEKGGNPHVLRVENYIRAQYMQPITVAGIAGELNLDRRYLARLFKSHTGCTIQEFLIRVRLEAAAGYLRQGLSVTEAAALSGYEDVSNFSKMFKRHYGISPAAYRH